MDLRNKTSKRIFIIDGYALLYRSHFALIRNPLITSYGLDTSALFGFINQILKIIRKEKPDYIVCAFDSKGKISDMKSTVYIKLTDLKCQLNYRINYLICGTL